VVEALGDGSTGMASHAVIIAGNRGILLTGPPLAGV
jgi:hypothetical protein